MDYIPGGGRRPAPTPKPVTQSEPTREPAASPTPVAAATSNYHQPKHTGKDKEPRHIKKVLLAIAVVVIIALVAGFLLMRANAGSGIDTSKYQAVFFTNGQVYFGKLQPLNGDYMKLTKVFYLQTKSGTTTDKNNPQATSDSSSDVQLIKLGDEIHGPQDEMIVSRDQLLFFENLKPEGKVATTIDQYLNKK